MHSPLQPWETFRRAAGLLLAHRGLWPAALVLGLASATEFLSGNTATAARTAAAPDVGQSVFACLSGIVVLALAIISLAASTAVLVLATDRALGGTLAAGAAWRQGWSRWWAVFVFDLLLGLYLALPALLLFVVVLIVAGGGLTTGTSWWYSLIVLPFGILYTPIAALGQCRVGVAYQTPREGLRRAWELYRANLGPLLGLGLLQTLFSGLIGSLPALLIAVTALGTPDLAAARLLLWPVAGVVLGFLAGWAQVSWALAHLTLDPPPVPAPAPVAPPPAPAFPPLPV